MPAEWEPHAATWLVWPRNGDTWPGKLLKEVESVYLEIISALLVGEKVNLLVNDKKAAARVLKALTSKKTRTQNLIFHEAKTVDTWIRDYGPIFVLSSPRPPQSVGGSVRTGPPISLAEKRGSTASCDSRLRGNDIAFTKWHFNAWGGKYSDLARDNGVVDKIPALAAYRRFDTGIILEGGSIDVNGRGLCLTTEQCLLNPSRNPELSREEVEGKLERYLGITKVIWLKEGIEGDDTDGHVDDIARFVNPTTVLAAIEPDTRDFNHAVLRENFEILRNSRNQDGKKLTVVELPMPGRVTVGHCHPRGGGDQRWPPTRDFGGNTSCRFPPKDCGNDRLPASYANFYIANRCVLAPVYGHRNDREALKTIRQAFPDKKVIGIDCTALVYGLGAIHCVTQQEPA